MNSILNFIKKYWLGVAIVIVAIIFLPQIFKKPRKRKHSRKVYQRAKRIKRANKRKRKSSGGKKKSSGGKKKRGTWRVNGKTFHSMNAKMDYLRSLKKK